MDDAPWQPVRLARSRKIDTAPALQVEAGNFAGSETRAAASSGVVSTQGHGAGVISGGSTRAATADDRAARALPLNPPAAPGAVPAGAGAGCLTVGVVSLGCPKNLVDSELMLGRLRQRGHRIVADARDADVIVVNTCAFIDRAKQESVDAILEMAREKETGRARRLVVTGCLAQRYDAELRHEIPEIDATLGTSQVGAIVEAVEGRATVAAPAAGLPAWVYDHDQPRLLSTPRWLAYLKISEGCDYTCSFCIIPSLRGRHRSRPTDDVVAEARALASRGVKELVLIAQDSTRYGLDRGIRDGLAELLKRLGDVDGLRWIRVMYAYPATLGSSALDAIASVEKVVKYVDIPLQHAADSVLKRMQRPFGRDHVRGLVARIRERVPGVAIRTSFIVGFPGETEVEFEALLGFVAEMRFDSVGVFTFSDEEGTSSFELPDRVLQRVKERRRRRLMAQQKQLSKRLNQEKVGRRFEVLVEGPHEESELLLAGRLATQAPEIDGAVIVGDGTAEAGSFVTCEVTEAHAYDLVGRVVA